MSEAALDTILHAVEALKLVSNVPLPVLGSADDVYCRNSLTIVTSARGPRKSQRTRLSRTIMYESI